MLPRQPFHLVQLSPWPIIGSLGAIIIIFSLSYWFHITSNIMPLSLPVILLTIYCWWRDVIRESSLCGTHTINVQQGLEWGIILFIVSEIMFFSAFFWTFFHSSLSPTPDIGCTWPPSGVWPLNPFSIPLLNTAVLLASGSTVTWAHHSLINNNSSNLIQGLLLTVILGAYFTYLQATEYADTIFSIADSVYGSTFFIATGFHGLHVIIGSIFLFTCLCRCTIIHLTTHHHFGLEAAAWYWHFVDVVWIFLFISIYWWGSP